MTEIHEAVAVWTTDDGIPTRLVWRTTRYRVTDTPTVWAEVCAWWRPFGEHRYSIGTIPARSAAGAFRPPTIGASPASSTCGTMTNGTAGSW
ncbi:DUF6504 family protein [Leifsonia poae]|uniref:DUF6504 family protein n=1 Tax=Leifsonia poae TaxID=110933 RepID=UPI001CBC6359|nr:DUF6504 family protein [Leifsonia poae]